MAGWKELSVVYNRLEDQVEVERGRQRLIAGLDRVEAQWCLARQQHAFI